MLTKNPEPVEVQILILKRLQKAEEHRMDCLMCGDETVKQHNFRTIVLFGEAIWNDKLLKKFLTGCKESDWNQNVETTWVKLRQFLLKLSTYVPEPGKRTPDGDKYPPAIYAIHKAIEKFRQHFAHNWLDPNVDYEKELFDLAQMFTTVNDGIMEHANDHHPGK